LITNLLNNTSVVKQIKGNEEKSIPNLISTELETHQHIRLNADVVKAADVFV